MKLTRQHLPSATFLDLPRRQLERYSLSELIDAAARDDTERLRFYSEISDTIQTRVGTPTTTHRSYYVPGDYLVRDMTVASASGGGYLVDAPVAGFASGLFANSIIGALPLRVMPMQGNGSMAVSTATPTVTWLSSESAVAADAAMSFGTRSTSPKSVSVVAHVSRQLDRQTDGAGMRFVEQQLAQRMAEAVGTALCQGSGTAGEPSGLLTISGTTSASGTSLGWSGILDLLAGAEGFSTSGLTFLLGTGAAKVLRAREKASGSGMVLDGDRIGGYPVIVTRCMPTDALLVADFSRVTWATWGTLEVTVTPLASATAFRTGLIGIRLMWSMDFAADHPSIIGKAESIT